MSLVHSGHDPSNLGGGGTKKKRKNPSYIVEKNARQSSWEWSEGSVGF